MNDRHHNMIRNLMLFPGRRTYPEYDAAKSVVVRAHFGHDHDARDGLAQGHDHEDAKALVDVIAGIQTQ